MPSCSPRNHSWSQAAGKETHVPEQVVAVLLSQVGREGGNDFLFSFCEGTKQGSLRLGRKVSKTCQEWLPLALAGVAQGIECWPANKGSQV